MVVCLQTPSLSKQGVAPLFTDNGTLKGSVTLFCVFRSLFVLFLVWCGLHLELLMSDISSDRASDVDMDSDDALASSRTSAKRKRQNDTPPDSRILRQSKKVNVCGHCNKRCTLRNEAIQCDLCQSWVHASCEALNKEKYEILTQLTNSVENAVYFYKLNSCLLTRNCCTTTSMLYHLTRQICLHLGHYKLNSSICTKLSLIFLLKLTIFLVPTII